MESDIIKDTTVLLTRKREAKNPRGLIPPRFIVRQYAKAFQVRRAFLFNDAFGSHMQSGQTNKLLLEAI